MLPFLDNSEVVQLMSTLSLSLSLSLCLCLYLSLSVFVCLSISLSLPPPTHTPPPLPPPPPLCFSVQRSPCLKLLVLPVHNFTSNRKKLAPLGQFQRQPHPNLKGCVIISPNGVPCPHILTSLPAPHRHRHQPDSYPPSAGLGHPRPPLSYSKQCRTFTIQEQAPLDTL